MTYIIGLLLAVLWLPVMLVMPFAAILLSVFTFQKVYAKWGLLVLADFLLMLTVPFVAPVVAAFTRYQPWGQPLPYTWGGWYGTYDNPPQGDKGFVTERCFFPGITEGLKGYINRVQWMIRNPLYGWAKWAAIDYTSNNVLITGGNPDISDKYGKPGAYLSKLYNGDGTVVAFELYAVIPWSETRDIRCRLGWKMTTDKFQTLGFAQLVDTLNPFDGYNTD